MKRILPAVKYLPNLSQVGSTTNIEKRIVVKKYYQKNLRKGIYKRVFGLKLRFVKFYKIYFDLKKVKKKNIFGENWSFI